MSDRERDVSGIKTYTKIQVRDFITVFVLPEVIDTESIYSLTLTTTSHPG